MNLLYKQEQLAAWGNVDDLVVARYLRLTWDE